MALKFSLAELEKFSEDKKNIKIKLEGDIVGEGCVENENIIIRTSTNVDTSKNIKIIKIEQDIEKIELSPSSGEIYMIMNNDSIPVNFPIKIKNMKENGMIVLKSLSCYPVKITFDSLIDNDFNDLTLYNNKSIELIWCNEEKMWIRGNEVYGRTTLDINLKVAEERKLNFFGLDIITAHIDIKILDSDKAFMYHNYIDWHIEGNSLILKNKKEMELNVIVDIIY